MRQHPDEGTLQAYLDGEILSEPREALDRHLEGCAECRARLRELDELATRTAGSLTSLESRPAYPDAARVHVRREYARRRAPRFRRQLAAAASLVLLLAAGAAAAMPGSPVRGWLADVFAGEEPAATEAPGPQGDADRPGEVAVEVAPLDGVLLVSVSGAAAGSMVVVEVTDREAATVTAPAGARFESAEGRLEVDLEGAGGELHVTVPRAARSAEVVADGALLFQMVEGEVSLPGDSTERIEDGLFRFELDGASEPGTPESPRG